MSHIVQKRKKRKVREKGVFSILKLYDIEYFRNRSVKAWIAKQTSFMLCL